MISALESHHKNGDYDNITESEKFAARLTEDPHGSGHDKHMRALFIEPRGNPDEPPQRPPSREILDNLRNINLAFRPITWDHSTVPGRIIATLPIDGFVPSAPELGSVS